jgi:hypothetical protein
MSEFPCWLYRLGEARIFYTDAEVANAGSGWVDSPAKVGTAQTEPAAVVTTEAGVNFDGLSIESLRAIADEHKIEYDGRWKEKRLIQAINDAIAKAKE